MNTLLIAQTQRDTIYNIASKAFNETREFKVHLPKNIQDNERLPVIIVFDAQWDVYYDLVTSNIDYLTEIKAFPKSIVVGINHKNRQYELTPAPINEDWKVPSLGGAEHLEQHLNHEVLPILEANYPIANFRIGLGHSLGGTFVINSLVDDTKLFNVYVAISPNLQLDDEEITLKIQRNISHIKNTNKLLYVTMGTKGNPDAMFLPYVKTLDSIIKPRSNTNFNWNFKILNHYNHATTPLASLQASLLLAGQKWSISLEEKETMLQSKDVLSAFKAFYTTRSKWAGYTISPQKSDYYNIIGTLEEQQKYNDAIALYKYALKAYPSTSRFYNGIAENFIKLENITEAKTYLNLALKTLEHEVFEYADDKVYFKKLYLKNLNQLNKH
jgi:predicted alpha/beta superfamily hydrolase